MHAFNYCVKKAGMENVDEEKMAQVMMNTSGRDIKYFAQQEIKTNKADNKVA
jgi:hypothetical protein